jgi:hypothetical protein
MKCKNILGEINFLVVRKFFHSMGRVRAWLLASPPIYVTLKNNTRETQYTLIFDDLKI